MRWDGSAWRGWRGPDGCGTQVQWVDAGPYFRYSVPVSGFYSGTGDSRGTLRRATATVTLANSWDHGSEALEVITAHLQRRGHPVLNMLDLWMGSFRRNYPGVAMTESEVTWRRRANVRQQNCLVALWLDSLSLDEVSEVLENSQSLSLPTRTVTMLPYNDQYQRLPRVRRGTLSSLPNC